MNFLDRPLTPNFLKSLLLGVAGVGVVFLGVKAKKKKAAYYGVGGAVILVSIISGQISYSLTPKYSVLDKSSLPARPKVVPETR